MAATYIKQEFPVEPRFEASQSGVSWPAVFAGALAAAILSLVLFMLGTGLGLSSISVWSGKGADGETIGWSTLAWLVLTQLASAGVGGYMAGRLRTKWQGLHTDEVYFRDTAHGFLAWALATIGMVVLTAAMVSGAVSSTSRVAGAVAGEAAHFAGGAAGGLAGSTAGGMSGVFNDGQSANPNGRGSNDLHYWINGLLRREVVSEPSQVNSTDTSQRARDTADDAKEVGVIFSQAVQTGKLPDQDAAYIANIVAQRSNVSAEEARTKVQQSFAQVQAQIEKAKQAAEQARKATAYSLLWMFVALLIGAFVASFCATVGGRQRDNV